MMLYWKQTKFSGEHRPDGRIGTEKESHTCINGCIHFNIIENFIKLTVVLESYKHFHTIKVHEGCFIISEDTVLMMFFKLLFD